MWTTITLIALVTGLALLALALLALPSPRTHHRGERTRGRR